MERPEEVDLNIIFRQIKKEAEELGLSREERDYFYDYYRSAGLLKPWRKKYFIAHFRDNLEEAANYLLLGRNKPLILDLGCGSGTQGIYLALKGARVVGIDAGQTALDVFKKRIVYYEKKYNVKLDIRLFRENVFNFDYKGLGPVDGIISVFAFNMMQPSAKLLDALLPSLSKDARLAVLDGNNLSWSSKLMPWRRRKVWSPVEFERALGSKGFKTAKHEGGVSLPPLLWNLDAFNIMKSADRRLNRMKWLVPVSHLIMAEKNGSA